MSDDARGWDYCVKHVVDVFQDAAVEGIDVDASVPGRLEREHARLRGLLISAVGSLKIFHGDPGWEIYWTHAPEMRPIREELEP